MTRPISEDSEAKRASAADYGTRQLFRRPAPVSEGIGIFEIKVFEDDEVVQAGDGKFKFDIPSDLDESSLIDFEAWITGASSSGDVIVSLYNNTQAVDMLSTSATIDVGELNDDDSVTPFVIDVANSEVAYKDELWINVDNAGTDALGLGVAVKFTPSENASIALNGAQGPAGGIQSFQGPWQDATTYNAGDIVTNNNITYVAIQDHTSNAANDEPGVGTNEADFWVPIAQVPLGANVNFNVYSSAGAIPDGEKGAVVIPFDSTIVRMDILAEQATDAEVDIWASNYGGYYPTSGDSIVAAAPPTLTGSIKNTDSTLTGWTTALSAGDILVFWVSGVTNARRLTVALQLDQ